VRPDELDSVLVDPANNVFFFIVDCSGSMEEGDKMEMTKEALTLFVQSLPAGCKFEIVLFDTKFKPMSRNGTGFVKNDATVKDLRERIKTMDDGMWGGARRSGSPSITAYINKWRALDSLAKSQ